MLGHPERGPSTSDLDEWGDFLRSSERDLQADFASRKATDLLPYLSEDIISLVEKGVRDFGMDPMQSFELVEAAARRVGIPHQYTKAARRQLVEEGYIDLEEV